MSLQWRNCVRQLFTGKDNKTLDLGRILWAKMSFVYCGLSIYYIYKSGTFSAQDWAIGAGVLLAGGGGALGLKAATEPKAEPEPDLSKVKGLGE